MNTYLPFANERIAVVAITRHGIRLACRVVAAFPGASLFAPEKFAEEAAGLPSGTAKFYQGKTGDQIPALFAHFDGIICIVSLGAVVRLIAPHLKAKEQDPGVIVMDEAGRFSIPVLSGHLGGANALATRLAEAMAATAVLTTASDARDTLAVDIAGREFGWRVEAPKDTITRACAAVVNDDPVAFVQEAGARNWWTRPAPLPPNIRLFDRLEDIDPAAFKMVLWASRRELPPDWVAALAGKLVIYRPPEEAE